MIKDNNFGSFLYETRVKKKIKQEQLCEGLCDVSMLSRIENGERDAEKLLKDSLLLRLGIVPENYENFLYYSVYKRCKERQDIVHCILYNDIAKAEELLKEYSSTYDMGYSLEEQFYLMMFGQIRSYQGASKGELKKIFKRAVSLTMPQIEHRGLKDRILSVEEMNLYLEYLRYREDDDSLLVRYQEFFSYIEEMELEQFVVARIYPKLVYYFWLALDEKQKADRVQAGKMLHRCNKAIGILQKANRMFFFWEILGIKETILQYLIDISTEETKRSVPKLTEWLEQCRAWRETLGSVYDTYGVSKETKDFCYLYVDREIYCIGDVVHTRREMFHLSMLKLSDGICCERTISRLEHNETEPQRAIVKKVFGKLNMAMELYKTDLIVDNPEARDLFIELKEQINRRNCQRVDELLEKLEKRVSLDISENRQVLERSKVVNEFYKGNIKKEDYVKQLKAILEYTIPYNIAMKLEEKYLTNNEISCLQNIIIQADESHSELEDCVNMLYDLYENQKKIENCLNMYEFVMGIVSSHLGNKKKYDISDEINFKILLHNLVNRRFVVIHRTMYDIFWNNEQRKKEQHPICLGVDTKDNLIKCLYFCEMSGDLGYIPFYQNKLKNS